VGRHRRNVNYPLNWGHFEYALITGLPRRYNLQSDPRAVGAVVVLSADESTYTGEFLVFWETCIQCLDVDPGPRKFNQGQPHPTGTRYSTVTASRHLSSRRFDSMVSIEGCRYSYFRRPRSQLLHEPRTFDRDLEGIRSSVFTTRRSGFSPTSLG
jgi:hypothetical protein